MLSSIYYWSELAASAASTAPLRATALPRSRVDVGMVRVAMPAALVKTRPPMVEKATEAALVVTAAVAAAAGAATTMLGKKRGAGSGAGEALLSMTQPTRARITRPWK